MRERRFRSWTDWKNEFSGNLAIFCSDERFANATLEFLRRHLDIERCDLFVVAGGPAFLTQNESSLVERLELLLRAHKIKTVALISHEFCGYYSHRYSDLDLDDLRRKQLEDLSKAAALLRQMGVNAYAFFAYVENGEIVFEEVENQ